MNDHDQLREQMWDLVYDLVTPEQKAALEGRIKSDPKAARLYAEVSLEADLISQAAKVADTSVTLPQVEPRREKVKAGRAKETASPGRGTRISRSLHWLAAVAASALAVVLTVGMLWHTEDARPAQDPVVVWVRHDESETLVAYLPATFQIETKDPSGSPAPVSLWARVADAAGKPLYEKQVQTDSAGKAEFSVPGPAVEVGAKLQIARDLPQQNESRPPRASERAEDIAEVQKREEVLVDALLAVEQEPIQAPTLFNQDHYVPGEDARFRFVPQTVISRKTPDISALAIRLHAPDGRVLEPAEAAPLDGTGVVTGRFRLPEDAPPGRYLFRLEGGSRVETDEKASILVTDSAERAKRSLSADDAPGPGLAAENGVRLRGAFGPRNAEAPGGFGGGEFEEREGSRDRPMKLAQGKMPKGEGAGVGGAARSAKTLPAPAEPAPPAPVEDATVALKSAHQLRLAKEKLEQAQQIVDAQQLAQTEGDGKRLAGVLDVPVPAEFAGKPVKIEAYFKQVLLGEQLVPAVEDQSRSNQSPPAPDGRQSRMAALPLAPWLDGEKVDLLFRDPSAPSSQPLAQRVEIPSLLDVALVDAKESYAPGEKVRLQVEVRKKLDGLSVPKAALGVVLKPAARDADEDLLKLAEASQNRLSDEDSDKARSDRVSEVDRRDMSRRKIAAGPMPTREGAVENKDVAKKDALAAGGAAAAPAAADGIATPPEPAARPAAEQENLTVQSGMERHAHEAAPADTAFGHFAGPLPPVVISNEVSVKKALEEEETARAARQAQVALWRARLGRWLLALGVVMLVALALAFAMQRPARPMVWIPSLGIAVASFAFGMMWIMQQPRHPSREMAKADATPAAVPAGDNGLPMSGPPLSDQPDYALGMDYDERSGDPSGGSYGLAGASNDTDGGHPLGAGPVGGTATGKPADVQKDKELARLPAAQPVEGFAKFQAKSESAPPAKGADAPRENLPGTSSNSPAPRVAAKEDRARPLVGQLLDLEKGEKKASGDASGTSRKLDDGRSEGKSLSPIDKVTQMLLKRMDEMSKDSAARGSGQSDDRKKELLEELFDEKLGKQAAAQGVWQPLLKADENGRAVIEFTMPEQPGDYRLVLDVSGLGHVGQLETKLRCAVQPAARAAPAASPEAKP